MQKKWLLILVVSLLVIGLYFIEFSKIDKGNTTNLPTLDHLEVDTMGAKWAPFYQVRATILNGQTARFIIPYEIHQNNGKQIEIEGACSFTGSGAQSFGDSVRITHFYLLPTVGLATACEILPDIKMRWTLKVQLQNPWMIKRSDMIRAEAKVKGDFRIDTSTPFDAAFFIDNASTQLLIK